MATPIRGDQLQDALKAILEEFGDEVFSAVNNEGLDAAEKVAIDALKAASPVGKTGKFKKSWKSQKYRLARYIGNSKTASYRGKTVPLSNILEYSTTRGHPFIKETFEANADRIASAMVDAIIQRLT